MGNSKNKENPRATITTTPKKQGLTKWKLLGHFFGLLVIITIHVIGWRIGCGYLNQDNHGGLCGMLHRLHPARAGSTCWGRKEGGRMSGPPPRLTDEREHPHLGLNIGPPWHGPWQEYIRAPENKSYILPERIFRVRGNVSTSSSAELLWGGSRSQSHRAAAAGIPGDNEFGNVVRGQGQGDGILLGLGGSLTVAFKENIGGRVCLDIDSIGAGSEQDGQVVVSLAYSESPWYAGPVPDATTDRQARDLPLKLKLKGGKTGKVCVGKDFVRGSFKYFTISVPVPWALEEEGDDVIGEMEKKKRKKWVDRYWLRIKSLWVVSTAYPAMEDGRKYRGYFYSSSDLLNRIWYAGAWTLQLSTIDPKEGSALIDYNRLVDHNRSPIGSWYSNFTISNGTSVTTDGAKRDRVVWPGDMFIAVPGIAVSTKDMVSVRNALDVLYDHQYGDGSLPYAGPPMGYHNEFSDTYHMHTLLGTHNYVLYSGDLEYLRSRWEAYLRALAVSISKVDSMGLLHVSSVADWLRPGMTGHNLEASAILYTVLEKSVALASWLSEQDNSTSPRHLSLISSWRSTQKTIENGLARLYCPSTGLFSDNIGVRSCKGSHHVDPQDGNSWVLISKLNLEESNLPYRHPKSRKRLRDPLPAGVPSAQNISTNLRNRWTKFGAPAVEFPNVISPFASGFELLAHCAAGDVTAAVELILLEWGYLLDGPGFTNSTLAEGFRVDGRIQYPAYPSPARNSHAHGWSSGPTSVLTTEVAGIEIKKYGGRSVHTHPRMPGWLAFVRAGYEFGQYGSWAESINWRVMEWVVDDDHDVDRNGGRPYVEENKKEEEEEREIVVEDEHDEFTGMKNSYGRHGKGQKPLVLQSTKHKRPGPAHRAKRDRESDDRDRLAANVTVKNSQGQRLRKTGRGGIISAIRISEHVREGIISFGGLFEDLWEEEEIRKGSQRSSGAASHGRGAPLRWEIDLSKLIKSLKRGVVDDGDGEAGKWGENGGSVSLAFLLRWVREDVKGEEDQGEADGSDSVRYGVAADGTRYRARPEVHPLTAWTEFLEPMEIRFVRPRYGTDKKEGEPDADADADAHAEEYEDIVLRFDEDFAPREMDTSRPPGVVDWDVMEENFRTPVYEGWSVERLKAEEADETRRVEEDYQGGGSGGGSQREREESVLEWEMEMMDGGFGEYMD